MSLPAIRMAVPQLIIVAMAIAAATADAESQTGTRVDSEASKLAVVQLHESSTVDEVQRLLEQGRIDEAVALAREYVDTVEGQVFIGEGDAVPETYFAWNSLCIALTKSRDYDEAIAACERAIRIQPNRWTAINNRGTAHYAAGSYEAALQDYRDALRVAPAESGTRGTIEHNIVLAEARIAPPD